MTKFDLLGGATSLATLNYEELSKLFLHTSYLHRFNFKVVLLLRK